MILREFIKASECIFMRNVRGKRGTEIRVVLYLLCPSLFCTFGTDGYQRQDFGLNRHLHDSLWQFLYNKKARKFQ